jgi:outer membrane immunogenic protein
MKNLTSPLAFAFALAAFSAQAADLPSRKGVPVYAPIPPAFTWTGLHAGLNAGYGFGERSDFNGFVGGGQVGYDQQIGRMFVVGVEADFQGADIKTRDGGSFFGDIFGSSRQKLEWFGTVRGRAGVTPFDPHFLVYGTGGFAYGQVRQGFSGFTDTQTGWTAGGGVAWAPPMLRNWSVKVEYLYTRLNNNSGNSFFLADRRDTRFHTVRAGVDYHFNLFAAAPILAKF